MATAKLEGQSVQKVTLAGPAQLHYKSKDTLYIFGTNWMAYSHFGVRIISPQPFLEASELLQRCLKSHLCFVRLSLYYLHRGSDVTAAAVLTVSKKQQV